MLPDLSSLSLDPGKHGACRACRPAPTGTIYDKNGAWKKEACPICLDPLGLDSKEHPWHPNPGPFSGPCCENQHVYHKGCIQAMIDTNGKAPCPECRKPILTDFLLQPGVFKTRDNLKTAVGELLTLDFTGATPHPIHGPINNWDVSNVKDMNNMFYGATSFNQPLNKWNVSRVKDMIMMFDGATSFNQPLNEWNVSGVTKMSRMFTEATSFNQPLNEWDVSKVKDMPYMFQSATSFNQPLNEWNVSNVERMDRMFRKATSFNQPLNKWNVSKVKNMNSMFDSATSFNQDLNEWNVSNVERMDRMFRGMFQDATAFNADPNTRPPRRVG